MWTDRWIRKCALFIYQTYQTQICFLILHFYFTQLLNRDSFTIGHRPAFYIKFDQN